MSRWIRYAGLISLAMAATVLLWINILFAIRGQPFKDLGAFLASGRAANAGRSPYGYNYPLVVEPGNANANLNPPVSVPLFALLARAEPWTVRRWWMALGLASYVLCLLILRRSHAVNGWTVLPLLLLGPAWHTLQLKQVYLFLLLPAVLSWLCLHRGRYLLAGLCLAPLIAMKPNFAFWPVALFVVGYRLAAITALLSAAALSAIPVAFYGTGVYTDWLVTITAYPGLASPGNSSLPALLLRLGAPLAGRALAIGLLGATTAYLWKTRPSATKTSGIAVLALLLASPIAWSGYTLFALPLLVSSRWRWPHYAALICFLVPFPLLLRYRECILLSWVYGLALVFLLGATVAPPTPVAPPCAAATPPGRPSPPPG